MSMYQFSSYLNNVSEIEKLFSGGESKKKESLSNKELVERARQKGLRVPKYY